MRRNITAAALCFLVALTLAPLAYSALAFTSGGSEAPYDLSDPQILLGLSSNVFVGKVKAVHGHDRLDPHRGGTQYSVKPIWNV